MSEIPVSGQASWLQGTPLRLRTWTTSSAGKLTLMAKSIGIEGVNPLAWVLIAVVLTSVLCSSLMTFWMVSRLDGQRWIGWTAQQLVMNGKARRVLIPLFMTPDDLKNLREGK